MDLRYTEAEERFRQELRAWLAATLPTLPPKPDPDDWPARRDYDTGWQARLHEGGYAGINWPEEYGGRGATLTEQLIYLEETTLAGAPYVDVLPWYVLDELGGEVLAGSLRHTQTLQDPVPQFLWHSDVELVRLGRGTLIFCQYRVFEQAHRHALAARLLANLLTLAVQRMA